MIIDCGRCAVRDAACGQCAVTFITRRPPDLDAGDLRALGVLADAGLIPPLRYETALASAPAGAARLPEPVE